MAMVVLLTAVVLAVVLTGPVVEAIADPLGIGRAAIDAWDYAAWPFLAAAVVLMLALLYYAAPDVRQPGARSAHAPGPPSIRGRGRAIMAALAEGADWRPCDGGTQVRLGFRAPWSPRD